MAVAVAQESESINEARWLWPTSCSHRIDLQQMRKSATDRKFKMPMLLLATIGF